MSHFDIATALVFTLLVLAAGLSLAKNNRDKASFFAAGGAVPWWISGLSLFMSFFSVGTFVIWGSIAYEQGLVAVTIQLTMSIAGFLVGLFVAPKWNATGNLTAAEFISQRLGRGVQKAYTYIFLFIALFTAGAFLYPVGKIIEVFTGLPIDLSILILGALIIAYTAVGGLWAVLVTDVLQFVVLSAAVLILLPLAFDRVDGIDQFIVMAPSGFFELTNDTYSWGFMFAFGLYNAIFIGGNWAYVQRYTSVKNPLSAKKVGLLFGALYIISPLIWMLPAMIYRVMHPELQGLESEGAYLMLAKEVLPKGLLGLVLGAMVFASASSVNTTLNISAGVFTNDIYRFLRPNHSQREEMLVAKAATVAFGVFAVIVALLVQRMGGIVEVVLSVAALTGGAMYLPPIWALYSKRQTGFSVFSATVLSLAINLFFKFASPELLDFSLSRAEEMLLGVLAPVSILTLFELWFSWQGQQSSQYLSYQKQLQEKPVLKGDSEEGEGNAYGKKVIARGVLAIGALIFFLGLYAEAGQITACLIGFSIAIAAFFGLRQSTANAT